MDIFCQTFDKKKLSSYYVYHSSFNLGCNDASPFHSTNSQQSHVVIRLRMIHLLIPSFKRVDDSVREHQTIFFDQSIDGHFDRIAIVKIGA